MLVTAAVARTALLANLRTFFFKGFLIGCMPDRTFLKGDRRQERRRFLRDRSDTFSSGQHEVPGGGIPEEQGAKTGREPWRTDESGRQDGPDLR
ncbi:hypothetical protein ACIQRS_30455 [Streptomyces termitum]|nr:hypothetical protein [Streptomyces termitum]